MDLHKLELLCGRKFLLHLEQLQSKFKNENFETTSHENKSEKQLSTHQILKKILNIFISKTQDNLPPLLFILGPF